MHTNIINYLFYMKKFAELAALAALVVLASSCGASKAKQMQMADNVKVNCTPEVLTLIGENIPAEIAVTYPDGYFAPKATMLVTPVLVYEGGEVKGTTYKYQGEKVKDNNKVISSKGGTVKEKMNFKYVKGMEKSRLELRSSVLYGGKTYAVPAIKVADGLNTTAHLVERDGAYHFKADEYQDVIHEVTEAQIMYDVNSANVKSSELRSESIQILKQALKDVANDPRYTLKGTKVVAYASPEGGENLNAKLSDKRGASAKQAWSQITSRKGQKGVEVESRGQDWEGFQEAIEKSDIDDKNLILRVLSMYSDPAVREREIRNMSQVYTEINKSVFPDLRRARYIMEADYQNFTDAELEELAEKAIETLDEEGLMRVAANTDSKERKAALYKRTYDVFNSNKGAYNLAVLALNDGRNAEAEEWLSKISKDDADVLNAKGICELRKGNLDAAGKLFSQSGSDEAKASLGAIAIVKGDYATAASYAPYMKGTNKALALLLDGQTAEAEKALTCKCAKADYLRAVIAARKGDKAGVKKYLDSACAKDPALKARSMKDVEFAKFN